ncbi:hypothetical protein [Janibacter limosus]|uniref:hypothetical protein n=1 Tax=Janibacter limosus TaxID=53458 RepID=UPI000836F7A0|nr:hypothetical protein [Janibacter limosus]
MAVGMLAAGAGAASAGEVTGNGKVTPAPQHASSLCVFSGQDTPDEIEGPGPDGNGDDWLGHGVQNYGQFVSHGLKARLGDERPGVLCRGNLVFE